MMDCTHYRRSILAAPHDPDPRLREHREICHECNLYTERLLRFESRLDRALRVDLPAPVDATAHPASLSDRVVPLRPRAHRPALPTSMYRRSWLAAAASVLLACVVAGALWLSVPRTSLAAAVVTHMAGEPDAWRRTDVPVPADALQAVLRDSHLRLTAGADMVSYANSCSFRGHQVPHLVVQTESGPVTVMVLVHERVPESVRFDEQGYRGVIVPVAGHGSIAVLTRGSTANPNSIGQIAVRVSNSIVWTG
jgi:hypothetical protein